MALWIIIPAEPATGLICDNLRLEHRHNPVDRPALIISRTIPFPADSTALSSPAPIRHTLSVRARYDRQIFSPQAPTPTWPKPTPTRIRP